MTKGRGCRTGFLVAYFFYQPTPDWSGFWLAKKSEGPSLWRATESWNPVRKSGSFKKNKNFFDNTDVLVLDAQYTVEEDAQQKIVGIIRRLEDAGEIVISRGGGDEIIA